MANKFLKSTDVKVFPTAYRNVYDPGAKFFSEENIGNILNSIIDNYGVENKRGFVVGAPRQILDGELITFNLHGYWFNMKFNYSDFNSFKPQESGDLGKIFALIEITPDTSSDTDNKKLKYAVLKNQNDDQSDNLDSNEEDPSLSVFEGVQFFSDYSLALGEIYQLQIAEWDAEAEKWFIPETSILKFNTLDILDKTDPSDSPELEPKNIRTHLSTAGLNEIDLNLVCGEPGSIVIVPIAAFIWDNNVKKYIWWIDNNGNFYQFSNNPQTSIEVVGINIRNATITSYLDPTDSWLYEADWCKPDGNIGTLRLYCVADSIAGLEDAAAYPYRKIDAELDSSGRLTLLFNNSQSA